MRKIREIRIHIDRLVKLNENFFKFENSQIYRVGQQKKESFRNIDRNSNKCNKEPQRHPIARIKEEKEKGTFFGRLSGKGDLDTNTIGSPKDSQTGFFGDLIQMAFKKVHNQISKINSVVIKARY